MVKQAPLTARQERELLKAQREFLKLCRLVDPVAYRRMQEERTRWIERLKALGMERSAISELSKDDGRLQGMTVVALDVACKRLRDREAQEAAEEREKAGAGVP
jgi:phosphotransacetylase